MDDSARVLLFRRVRRSKIVQWSAAYLAGAWLLLQVLDLVASRFGWSDQLIRGAIIVLTVGFVAALIIAWYHGEQGRQQVTSIELALLTVLSIIGAVGVAVVRGESSLRVEAALAPPASRLTLELPDGVGFLNLPQSPGLALSRDGSRVAFGGTSAEGRAIFLRSLSSTAVDPIRGTAAGTEPHFSPDGAWLLFLESDTRLAKVPVTGGPPVIVADSAGLFGASWGDGDAIVFTRDNGLWQTSSLGGTARLLAQVDSARGHLSYRWPWLLPGSNVALITLWKGGTTLGSAQLGLVDLSSGEVTELGIPGTAPRYVSSGHLIFAREGGTVFTVPFSLRRLRPSGVPQPVMTDVLVKPNGALELAASENGTFIYAASATAGRRVVAVTLEGSISELGTERRLFSYPRVSPDGQHIAVTVSTGGSDVWILDTFSGTLTPLTTNGQSWRAEWHPDRRRIAYVDAGGGPLRIQPWDGSEPSEVLLRADRPIEEFTFGPPGTFAAFRPVSASASERDIWLAPLDSLHLYKPLIATSASEAAPRISPDGRTLAYVTDEAGGFEVYVRPIPGPGPRVRVSTGGGRQPVWSPRGDRLFYRTPTHMISATLVATPRLSVVRTDTLFSDHFLRLGPGVPDYDVFPMGDRLVMIDELGSGGVRLHALVNWLP